MTSGQDVSEYLDTFGLVKSYFFKFFEKMKLKKIEKKSKKKMSWCLDAPEDEAISLFPGLLANPDMRLSRHSHSILSRGGIRLIHVVRFGTVPRLYHPQRLAHSRSFSGRQPPRAHALSAGRP
jgi:hypothetical protein